MKDHEIRQLMHDVARSEGFRGEVSRCMWECGDLPNYQGSRAPARRSTRLGTAQYDPQWIAEQERINQEHFKAEFKEELEQEERERIQEQRRKWVEAGRRKASEAEKRAIQEQLDADEKARIRRDQKTLRPYILSVWTGMGIVMAGAIAQSFALVAIGIGLPLATMFGMAYVSVKRDMKNNR